MLPILLEPGKGCAWSQKHAFRKFSWVSNSQPLNLASCLSWLHLQSGLGFQKPFPTWYPGCSLMPQPLDNDFWSSYSTQADLWNVITDTHCQKPATFSEAFQLSNNCFLNMVNCSLPFKVSSPVVSALLPTPLPPFFLLLFWPVLH